ncbi:MAG TPA: hypothetical protein DCP03_15345 [Polaromonas sp.]|uniref:type II toxin -antitoxin system TacA 1-like antitoxin n=1 Tax=Polaromonas sp. UBA4122 TaxID=1947074 RepID=UPI000EE1374D|nr:DUF1778 domain-containing protein [Polaromonas sp. UBA4122]HAL39403.1 hypothetical protein [Polaromonas sp.]
MRKEYDFSAARKNPYAAREIIRLSLADQERMAQALLSPPEPAPALQRAVARRQKLLKPE